MNSFLFLALVIGCSFLTGTFQSESIQWDKNTHDFGQIPQGPSAECKFEFVNTGEEAIIIENVKSSCGCVAPDWYKKPVMPGDTGWVGAMYSTASVGIFVKTITANYRIGDSRNQKTFYLKGEVVEN